MRWSRRLSSEAWRRFGLIALKSHVVAATSVPRKSIGSGRQPESGRDAQTSIDRKSEQQQHESQCERQGKITPA